MTNDDRWELFITELKAYIEEHHHCPNKHCTLYNAQKYYRRKMKDGTLDEEKRVMFEALLATRSAEHTGGRRKASLR